MLAIVDVGSNTVRMNVYRNENDEMKLMFSSKVAAGLAAYVKDQQMTTSGINKVVDVLAGFKRTCDKLQVEDIRVFATAALRNCKNSEKAVDEVIKRTGLHIHVVSGETEAELDFIGAAMHSGIGKGLLVDIGGGSTELVVFKDGEILNAVSMPIGSLNTYTMFVSNILPTKEERKAIKKFVVQNIEEHSVPELFSYDTICGVGGTIRAARKLNNHIYELPPTNMDLDVANVRRMIKMLERKTDSISKESLSLLMDVVPERIRTVVPGMIILNTIIKYFECKHIQVSACGAREGYMYKYVINGGQQAAALATEPSEDSVAVEAPAETMATEGW